MGYIEISCKQYPDLTIKVDENPSDDSLQDVQDKALEIVYICDKRSLGGDCPGSCALPKIGVAENLSLIRQAIEQASTEENSLPTSN